MAELKCGIHSFAGWTGTLVFILTVVNFVAATQLATPKLRDLQFGDINFLHTTDTHGWHGGHLLEPSFNATWGDYISFSEHLRAKLEAEGKDLLLVDTGDRIEGNGLYDASDPRGKYTFGIFDQQNIDLICIGNHELYKNTSAEDDFTKLVPVYKDNYIASNLQILDHKSGKLEQFAQKYRKFTTKNGLRIMAFGFIFDFTRNDKNTVITPVEITVKEPWFQDAIRSPDVDLIVVTGHVALRQQEFEFVQKEIRNVNSTIPIQFFGGHYHIRDYRIFDDKAHALASGRFMETIGFQSISNLTSGKPTFSRRYIDNNLVSFTYHSNTTMEEFHTKRGLETDQKIADAREALHLDQTFGYAPQTYWMSQVPYNDSSSIFTLLTEEVFPDIVQPARSDRNRMIITNTGAIRFDIFAGAFTRDSTFIVSPFTSNFSFIPDVPYRLATQILPILNNGNPQISDVWEQMHFTQRDKLNFNDLAPPEEQARRATKVLPNLSNLSGPEPKQPGSLAAQNAIKGELSVSASADLTPGYTTHDDLGSDGDDTPHSMIPTYTVPNCVQSIFPGSSSTSTLEPMYEVDGHSSPTQEDVTVDLVFNAFLTPYILKLLNLLPYLDSYYDGKLSDHEEYMHSAAWAITDLHSIDAGYEYWEESMSRYQNIDVRHIKLGFHPDIEAPLQFRKILQAMQSGDVLDRSEDDLTQSSEKSTKSTAERPVWNERDVQNYMPGETFTTLLAKWVSKNWAERRNEGAETLSHGSEL